MERDPSQHSIHGVASASASREQARRLEDDLQMLQIERQISLREYEREHSTTRSLHRSRSRREEPVDEFDVATNPLHEQANVYRPPETPSTNLAKLIIKIHSSSWLVRWSTYITPVVLIILIPLLLGALKFKDANVGGVELVWFCIWLEIAWLTLWAGRVSPHRPMSATLMLTMACSFSQNACPGLLDSCPAWSLTTARNGVTWASN